MMLPSFMPRTLPVQALLSALIPLLFALGPACAHAQPSASNPAPDTSQFEYELSGRFSGTQNAYRNWQEGGLNTLSFSTTLDGAARNQAGRWQQQHALRLSFGLLTSEADNGDEPIRKTDDLIRLESNLRYTGSGFFRRFKPSISARVRTQFAKGFDYSSNPFPAGHPRADREAPVQTSAFLAPATFVETLGLTYAPSDWYTISLSAAAKQTVVRTQNLRVLYDVDRDRLARAEGGAEIGATLDREIAEDIRYQSNATVFFSAGQIEDPPDALWENFITMRVNSWLTTNLEFVALFDQNTSDAIQLKEVLSVGVTVDFI
jgi:hypothetical protein